MPGCEDGFAKGGLGELEGGGVVRGVGGYAVALGEFAG